MPVPLSYCSSKAVLQFMDANKRFRISNKCPNLLAAEKAAPFQIRYLSFDKMKFTVNEATYQLGLYRQFENDEDLPDRLKMENESGGSTYDLEKNGQVKIYGGIEDMAPGGILGAGKIREPKEDDIQLFKEFHKLQLAVHRDMASCDGPKSTVPRLSCLAFQVEYERVNAEQLDSNNLAFSLIERKLTAIIERANTGAQNPPENQNQGENRGDGIWQNDLVDVIDRLRSFTRVTKKHIAAVYSKPKDFNAPTEILLQLTITSKLPNGQESKKIERYQYSQNLPDAFLSLTTKAFGSRRLPIQVKHLEVPDSPTNLCTAKLPESLKLRIQELKSDDMSTIVPIFLKPYIHSSSHPLELLDILKPELMEEDYSKARQLILRHRLLEPNSLQFLKKLETPKLYFVYEKRDLNVESFRELISDWIEKKKESGTCFKFGIGTMKRVQTIFEGIKEGMNMSQEGERSFSIPMTDSSKIVVSYAEVDNIPLPETQFSRIPEWIIKMEVTEIQNPM
ncbi:hypothetical protein B9Z55_006661 [Caenorhabditis nigoni]|nr:hypothetical protein B9Z55_006661 [Caenorhabditis nigoni]